MKRRIIAGIISGTIVAGSVFGLAASLTVTSQKLGSGTATVASCDADGVNAEYSYNGSGQINTVTLTGVSSDCFGATARVTLAGAELTESAASIDPGETNSVAVTFDPTADPAAVTGVTVTLTGGNGG
ncbi:MAG: hypothetical protein ACKOYM_01385 [Actinomycetes bacterium]